MHSTHDQLNYMSLSLYFLEKLEKLLSKDGASQSKADTNSPEVEQNLRKELTSKESMLTKIISLSTTAFVQKASNY